MHLARSYAAVEVHAEGEQGTCYLGSVFEVPGLTAREKLHYLNAVDDSLRRVLTLEPAADRRRVPTWSSRRPTPMPMRASSSSRPIGPTR